MDRVSPKQRSKIMSRVRSKNTGPELLLRQLVWSLGYRYRLHLRNLPGRPDIVFPRRKKVIFVHGCFWHRHNCPGGQQMPKTRPEFWGPKLSRNAERDQEVEAALREKGWSILVVWSCQVKDTIQLKSSLRVFLGPIHF